ncbi:MAG: GerAB/ArcD/ProY family transporter [Bacillota bacterium]
MNKEIISDKQATILIITYLIGITTIMVSAKDAKQDFWLAIILALFAALIFILICARLHVLFPGKDLFDILQICFGRFVGKGLGIMFIGHVFLNAAASISNVGQFITSVSLERTPVSIVFIFMIILCIGSIKAGLEVISRASEIFFFIFIVLIGMTTILLIPEMDIHRIQPVLSNGIGPVLKGAFGMFVFPLSSTIVFTAIYTKFERKHSPYYVYTKGLLAATAIIAIISLTDVLVLGVNSVGSLYFPSYAATARINIGNILQRMEVLAGIVFILGSFVRISIMLLSVCRGIAKIFEYTNYRFVVTPTLLLQLNLSYLIFGSIMESYELQKIWPLYTLPFYVILPIMVWIAAEIKNRGEKNEIEA